MVMRIRDWIESVTINAEKLVHLSFASDILLIPTTMEELQKVLMEVDKEGAKIDTKSTRLQ